MGSKLGSPSITYLPLSKAEITRIIERHTRVLHKQIEKVRKNLLELEFKCSEGGIK